MEKKKRKTRHIRSTRKADKVKCFVCHCYRKIFNFKIVGIDSNDIYLINQMIFSDVCGSKATKKQKISLRTSIFNENVNIIRPIHQFVKKIHIRNYLVKESYFSTITLKCPFQSCLYFLFKLWTPVNIYFERCF